MSCGKQYNIIMNQDFFLIAGSDKVSILFLSILVRIVNNNIIIIIMIVA